MKKKKTYRHGEILFIETKKIPKEAKLKKTNVFMRGSGNNPHSFKGGEFYKFVKIPYIFGYFEAKNTTLTHIEHGEEKVGSVFKEVNLPDGIYELRKGQEFINAEMKPIID